MMANMPIRVIKLLTDRIVARTFEEIVCCNLALNKTIKYVNTQLKATIKIRLSIFIEMDSAMIINPPSKKRQNKILLDVVSDLCAMKLAIA